MLFVIFLLEYGQVRFCKYFNLKNDQLVWNYEVLKTQSYLKKKTLESGQTGAGDDGGDGRTI